ncbi:response regulator [Trinickia acidisoli]|uniref:response regulator n=1 Tax=Trinickia acidisoli TaxID=2767482 RepID=UPI001A8F5B50|nr:response regulator [Trinickia acidisoli]
MGKDPYRYFRVEARELLDQICAGVLELEKGHHDADLVARLLRLAHTLKGAAHVVKLGEIAELTHTLEEDLAPYRGDGEAPERNAIDGMLKRLDAIEGHLSDLPSSDTPTPAVPAKSEAPEPPARAARTDVAMVDALLEGLNELSSELANMRRVMAKVGREWMLPASAERNLTSGVERMGRELHQLRDTADRLRLTPVSNVFTTLERVARDAAHSVGKQVQFVAGGGEVRLDGQVLDIVQDALVQLVRNAVAHGIETAAERLIAGKPAAGRITLQMEQQGCHVLFRCIDDGAGVDLDAVEHAARSKGATATHAGDFDAGEWLSVLLKGGISTTRTVTALAGRGVGLDVVREAMQRLNGKISGRTARGEGTAIELRVPVSLASIEVLVVEICNQTVAIPLDAVRGVRRVSPAEIVHAPEGDGILDEGVLIRLISPVLGRTATPARDAGEGAQARAKTAAILTSAGVTAAVKVDRLYGAESILLRPLPALAAADATVAGTFLDRDGVPRAVLAPEALIAAPAVRPTDDLPASDAPRPILIIDDSLTTRMLETSILESAGFTVESAASAEEGLEMARFKDYALFLVDIEMPGMDGFEFVELSRGDVALREVPCILVSSRDSAEDKRRAEVAGAAAYIVKSKFDQTEFLQRVDGLTDK